MQIAGVDGIDTFLGTDRDGGGVFQGKVFQPRQSGTDEGIPAPEGGGGVPGLDAGGQGGVIHGGAAALQVEDLRLQQGTGLGVGRCVGGGHAAALHGKIAVQQHAPADAEGRREDEDQQRDKFLVVAHRVLLLWS